MSIFSRDLHYNNLPYLHSLSLSCRHIVVCILRNFRLILSTFLSCLHLTRERSGRERIEQSRFLDDAGIGQKSTFDNYRFCTYNLTVNAPSILGLSASQCRAQGDRFPWRLCPPN